MRKSIFYTSILLLLLHLITGCVKKIDAPNFNIAKVVLTKTTSDYVTSDTTVAPGSNIPISFTISCEKPMMWVLVSRNDLEVSRDTIKNESQNSFTSTKLLVAETVPGVYTYRIYAKDEKGTILGGRFVTVTVTSDINYFTVRSVHSYWNMSSPSSYPLDSVVNLPAYISATDGNVYNFNDAGKNSAKIDLAYFYNYVDSIVVSGKKVALGNTIYALNITPVPSLLSPLNTTSWTKNATVMKKITLPTFANLNSSKALQDAATTGASSLATGASSNINQLASGNVILFKTAGGKIGALQINYIRSGWLDNEAMMNIDIKIQR